MNAKQFEGACSDAIEGNIWDYSFTPEYTHPVSLSVAEMRQIANLFRQSEGYRTASPIDLDEFYHCKICGATNRATRSGCSVCRAPKFQN